MPISKQPDCFAQRAVMALLLSTLLTSTAIATVVLYIDPYSLWRARPISQDMSALDRKMRFAKALQIYTRPIKTAFLGSSTVYRGINPADLPESLGAYNLGVSSLRATEVVSYINALVKFHRPDDVVIGLDYFMFDRGRQTEAGFDSAIDEPLHAAELLLQSILGKDAISDAVVVWKARNKPTEDGVWLGNGFKKTFSRTEKEVQRIRINTAKEYHAMVYDVALLSKIESAIDTMRASGIKAHLYFSPVHADFYRLISEAGQMEDYYKFKSDIFSMAKRLGVSIHDFSDMQNSGGKLAGSNENWIDITHYQPSVGGVMTKKIFDYHQ